MELQLYNLRLGIAIVRFLELHSGISFVIIALRNCNYTFFKLHSGMAFLGIAIGNCNMVFKELH